MIESKAWDWSKNEDNYWLIPTIEACYLTESWKSKGFNKFLDLGCGLGRHSIYFAGKGFEIMKAPGRGKLGHIAVGVNSLTRSVKYMQSLGYKFDINGVKTDVKGNYTGAVYFEQEISGFAVHLVQKV
jgi:SAM-dependent methyltransferase